jgi:anti-sigma-K factor RskA
MSAAHDELALTAPYVLGALEPHEREAFERHLESCAVCLEEVRSLARVADALARAVPLQTPRAELRARVLGSLTDDSPAAIAGDRRPPQRSLPAWLPLAATIVVVAGLGIYAWQLQQRVATLEARLDDAERRADRAAGASADARRAVDEARTALAVLGAPDLVRIDLAGQPAAPQANARAMWSRDRGMVFTVTGLPPAPAGRVYQVWVVTAQAPVSAGLLTTDASGRATVFFPTPPDIAPPIAVAVTLEPAGGVPAPTGARFLAGTPL